MEKLVHGGDWASYRAEYGGQPLDFSSNVSPLGLPESVRRAAEASLRDADRYPDPLCRELCSALSERYNLPAEQIVCGAGAADLIWRIALTARGGKALLTAPTFSEYETALASSGVSCGFFPLKEEEDFAVTEEILFRIDPSLDLLFLCEPNNPTGRTTEPALLRKILTACAENGVLLVIDECFLPFLDDPAAHTLTGFVSGVPNLIVLRAFTKWYGMAGLRLGYALCGSPETARALRVCGQPWAVSTAAQAAGIAAFTEEEYGEKLRALIGSERPRLAAELVRAGCRVVPGEANYLLFYHPDKSLCEKLSARGILLRDCSGFAGLVPGWYRAAVRTKEENDVFLRALREVLTDGETHHGAGDDVGGG